MSAQILPFTRERQTANPYKFGTELWLAFSRGAACQDEKWRAALVGKLPPAQKDGRS